MKQYFRLTYYFLSIIFAVGIPNSPRLLQHNHDFISSNLLKSGTAAPYFEAINSKGEQIHYSDYRGKLLLLDWWYIGCKPCIKTMTDIQSIQDELGKDNFVILGMNPINKPNAIKRFKRKHKYHHTVLIPDERIKNAYKIRAYPTVYLIGKDGKIVYAKAGYSQDFAKELKEIIETEIRNHPEVK